MIEIKDVYKKYENSSYPALDHINLTINDGELITVLGTSGCGKTTLIKAINKLHDIDSGEIIIDHKNINDVDGVALRRTIGYVIQQVGLFPHMTIAENIATIPELLKWEKDRINKRVDELLEMIDLPKEYKNRYPRELSGGQQQRVGLVRALAADPHIVLLDEPFGAIDAITREHLQDELIRIHKNGNKIFIFVTHDLNEAFKLGDKVIIMDKGRVEQFDTPDHIKAHPATPFVKKLLGVVYD